MKTTVQGLDGRTYELKLAGKVPQKGGKCSQYHLRARALLRGMFPTERLHEEVVLPGSGKLRLDFLLPMYNLAVEVHGQQHYTFTPHWHLYPHKFWDARRRDMNKADWCSLNNLALAELPFNETDDEWRKRITAALQGGTATD